MLFLCFIIFLLIPPETDQDPERYLFEHPQMGTLFKIIMYAHDEETAVAASDSAFQRIDALNNMLSDYVEDSELNQLPVRSGDGTFVRVSDELYHVIHKAQSVSQQTDGAFDITIGPFVELWRAMNRQDIPRLPDQSALDQAGQAVGYRHIKLDTLEQKAALNQPGMQLDLGGIAKGYAADEALKVLQSYSIESALIDAGGDITTGDAPPGKDGWQINIPRQTANGMNYLTLILHNRAVATSGDLFQYTEIEGERYSHIIDPETGLGITSRRMVTVIAADGITADSYASALSVLGPEKGMKFTETKPEVDSRFEFRKGDTIHVLESAGFKEYVIAEQQRDQ
ncbi:MAG: FAD:protein FMN transferase [Balneolaceae bacterium]